MNLQRIFVALAALAAMFVAWQKWQWMGVLFVVSGIVMWALLHVNRLVQVMRKAADRPKGYVGSAVMLNAKLRPRVNLLHVITMTQSLGEQVSPDGEQPEVFRWKDGTDSTVTCEFLNGRLVKWELHRPQAPADAPAEEPQAPAP